MSSNARRRANVGSETVAINATGSPDLICQALDHISRGISSDGNSSGPSTPASQKAHLLEWAKNLGLLLNPEAILPLLRKGGQEHDIFHDPNTDRIIKVTKHGMFGLSPGIELDLVSTGDDRRFHLWEATLVEYFERLYLHNQLIPEINKCEGVLVQADDELAVVTSQPRFDLISVSERQIDDWFSRQGFTKVTTSGYYRREDNLAVFDAHAKNVVRFEDDLVPFDIIPCRPKGNFLKFIDDTLAAGYQLRAVRSATTDDGRLQAV